MIKQEVQWKFGGKFFLGLEKQYCSVEFIRFKKNTTLK